MEMYILVAGVANSQVNSLSFLLGTSPGTVELGFLALQIFLNTSYSSNLGTSPQLGLLKYLFHIGRKS